MPTTDTNIVAGLFGIGPQQAYQQIQQQGAAQDAQAFNSAGGTPGQLMAQAYSGVGRNAVGLGAGLMGIEPTAVIAARQQEQVMQGADTGTPEGLMAIAKRFNDAGMPQQAAMAVQAARKMQAELYKQQLDASTIAKNEATAYKDTNLGDAALLPKPEPTSNDEKLVKAAALANGLVEGTPAYNAFAAKAYQKLMDKRTHITIPMSAMGQGNSLSPEAIDAAANTYRMTGQMPALGMGGMVLRTQILNRAGELAKLDGSSGQAEAINKIANKSNQAALSQLEKQATMVGAFEKTARANADLALSLSNNVDRAGVPVVDKWIQAGRKSISGDPDVAKFHAANETFINEYAKIMSGSMGNTPVSDAARANAHEILSHAYTKEQYKQVIGTLKQEMDNRISGFNQQRNELRNSISHGSVSNIDSQPTVHAKGGVKFLGFE